MTAIFFSQSARSDPEGDAQLIAQAIGLKAKGYRPHVLCQAGSSISLLAMQAGLRTHYLSFRNALDPSGAITLAALLRRHRPSAIVCYNSHDTNLCALASHALARLGWVKPRPMLIRMRNHLHGTAKAFTHNALLDHTYVSSDTLRDRVLRDSGVLAHKVSVLYPALDVGQIVQRSNAALPAVLECAVSDLSQRPLIAHVQPVDLDSGHVFMLEVLAGAVKTHPGLRYMVMRSGPHCDALAQAAKRWGLGAHLLWVDPPCDTEALLKRADVVVLPAHRTAQDSSAIVAMALGVPLIASDVGQITEFVQSGKTGRLCLAPHEPGALANWLEALLDTLGNPTRAQALAKAGQRALVQQLGPGQHLEVLLHGIHTMRLDQGSAP
ncbi:MAG TPA: glycosyltransferase family 4 protein [Limnobacter sp.]|nr:glycosyltransferase family 4 protein [Limnobacter sp.]